jgi:hypothetical protein
MSVLERVLQRTDAVNFDNRVVALVRNLQRYGVLHQPIPMDEGAVIEVLLSLCDELEDMDQRILRLEVALAEFNAVEKVVNEKMSAPVDANVQLLIDGSEKPHSEVVEETKPKAKPTRGCKAAK